MKPKRTPNSNVCLQLEGGNEDNYLWAEKRDWDGWPCFVSDWELTDEDREKVANGAKIELWVIGTQHPPVSLQIGEA